MKLIRAILRFFILAYDRTFKPVPETRSLENQSKVDRETASLALYHFEACPFCVKVRRHIVRRGLKIEMRDVKRDKRYDKELMSGGGKFQVPCLRITQPNGAVEWLYESSDIMSYLDRRFPPVGAIAQLPSAPQA